MQVRLLKKLLVRERLVLREQFLLLVGALVLARAVRKLVFRMEAHEHKTLCKVALVRCFVSFFRFKILSLIV